MGTVLKDMDKMLKSRKRASRSLPPDRVLPPELQVPERVSRYEVPSLAHEKLGLWVSSVGRHINQGPQSIVRGRVLDSFAGVLISRGQGFFESPPTGRRTVRAGCLMWIVPGVAHSYSAEGGTWDEHWVVFGGRVADAFLREGLIQSERPLVEVGPSAEVAGLLERMLQVFLAGGPLAVPMAAGLAYQLVIQAYGHATGFLQRGPSADPAIGEAVRLIERDAARGVSPLALARNVHVGYSTLRRRFREQTGFSVKEYIQRVQLRRAKELLATTRQSVNEIARACGFGDALYFSRLFQRKVGMPPTQFRSDEWRNVALVPAAQQPRKTRRA